MSAGCEGVLIVLEGSGTIGSVSVTAGQVCLITADSGAVRVEPNRRMKLLHATCGSES